MIEKPDLADETLLAHLRESFAVPAVRAEFLPLGADQNTAVYRVTAAGGRAYFCKLRKGDFNDVSVRLPRLLVEQGVAPVIDPLDARSGSPVARLEAYHVILYPFIAGSDGYDVSPQGRQWSVLGRALRGTHAARVPPELSARIRRDDFSPAWREVTRAFLDQSLSATFADPLTARLMAFLNSRRETILRLLRRADRLSRDLQSRSPELCLCHGDIHPGNWLICPGGEIYIVDWDDPIFSLPERDLMFFRGLPGREEEEKWFMEGYGPAPVDWRALAYYRSERIIVDIAEFCRLILDPSSGPKDRAQSLDWLTGAFEPGHEVDTALHTDPDLMGGNKPGDNK